VKKGVGRDREGGEGDDGKGELRREEKGRDGMEKGKNGREGRRRRRRRRKGCPVFLDNNVGTPTSMLLLHVHGCLNMQPQKFWVHDLDLLG